MGIVAKRKKADSKKPLFQDSDSSKTQSSSPGHLSSNLITQIYTPKLTSLAIHQSETYAAQFLEYHEAQKLISSSDHFSSDNDDTNITTDPKIQIQEETPITFVKPPKSNFLFGTKESTDEFINEVLVETANYFTTQEKSSVSRWKIAANAAKFERLLNQKYGRLRPFITRHPEIEDFIRIIQRKLNKGELVPSPFRQGNPPLDRRTSIIILFMMHRNGVRFEVTLLSFLFFIVGLQPWVVVTLVTIGHFILMKRRKSRVKGWHSQENIIPLRSYYAQEVTEATDGMHTNIANRDEIILKAKQDCLLQPVGKLLSSTEFTTTSLEGKMENYDTLIVGSGPATLYTAALLSRTGRSVLVLSESEDASGMHVLQNSTLGSIPVDIECHHIAHTKKIIPYLAPALVTDMDSLGGIRFARIGTEADGYTSDILSVPGMGVDNANNTIPYLLRAGGIAVVADDAATFLADGWTTDDGIGNSTSAAYMTACSTINDTATDYYLTKLLSQRVNGMKKDSPYQEASVRYASSFLNKLLPLNAHVRSLMAAMGMRNENLVPSKTSMAAHITNVCSFASNDGFTYPIGGPRAICHALATVIEQCGGAIRTGMKIKEFVFEDLEGKVDTNDDSPANTTKKGSTKLTRIPRCHGVRLHDDRIITIGTSDDNAVISMMDFISTFILYTPDEIRSKYGVPSDLTSLTERRPLLRFIFSLQGSHEELELTGADWYRLPNASIARDEIDVASGQIQQGFIGEDFSIDDEEDSGVNEVKSPEETNHETAPNNDSNHNHGKVKKSRKSKGRKLKFETGKSWMKISFPSTKDPSWTQRHGDISTCVVSIEADDDFCQLFDTKPKVFSCVKYGTGEMERLLERVKRDLLDVYPQLEGKIDCVKMLGPFRMGLSHVPERYVARGIRPVTHYPGLFMGGSDLSVGDSLSASIVAGWMVSNAVVGYKFVDYMVIDKNITTDLNQYQLYPRNIEDLAVPYSFPNSDRLPQSCEFDCNTESRKN